MNWNGQRKFLDHLIAVRHEPQRAVALQAELNSYRLNRVAEACRTRPKLIPLKFEMAAAGQVTPYRESTPYLAYDVLITGVKSDCQTRDLIVTLGDTSLVKRGNETNLYLRCDELAGITASTTGGQRGIQYLTTPLLLREGWRLTVEMFKTDDTDDAETRNIVFHGIRVYPRNVDGPIPLGRDELALVERQIAAREVPQQIFLKQMFSFDSAIAGGVAGSELSPICEEPLLIRGCRTSLRWSSIEVGLVGEENWTVSATPCWSIGSEDDGVHDNWMWFSKPIYLHSRQQIELRRIVNGANDGVEIDAETGNTLTWICETV